MKPLLGLLLVMGIVGCGGPVAELEKLGATIERNDNGEAGAVIFDNSEVTDAGLGHLKELTKLQALDLPAAPPAAGAGSPNRESFPAIVPPPEPWELRDCGVTQHASASPHIVPPGVGAGRVLATRRRASLYTGGVWILQPKGSENNVCRARPLGQVIRAVVPLMFLPEGLWLIPQTSSEWLSGNTGTI